MDAILTKRKMAVNGHIFLSHGFLPIFTKKRAVSFIQETTHLYISRFLIHHFSIHGW